MQGRLLVPALVVCVLSAAPLAAQTHTLGGKVFGGGSPLPNTTVEALNDGTTTVAAQTTTNASGQYALSLADGTYDLRVTPPAGSGFGQETVQNIVISGGDRTYDVILLAESSGLRGTLRGYGGAPIANANVYVYTTGWQFIASTTTGADGKYSLALSSGAVILRADAGWPQSAAAPSSWSMYRYNLAVTGSMTLDIDVPVVKVSGTVRDAGGAALANATVQAESNNWDNATQTSWNSNMSSASDANGYYEVLTLSGSSNFVVRPPAGADATAISQTGVSITGDTTRDFELPAPSIVSGIVRGYDGKPVANANIYVYTSGWQFITSTTSDANGAYSVGINGTVIIRADAGWPQSSAAPSSWSMYRYSVAISGSTTLDIDLPVVKVSGTVRDANGTALANATVQAESNNWDNATQTSWNSNMSVSTDANGYYEVLTFAGNSNFVVRPPSGVDATAISQTGVAISADTTRDFDLPAPSIVSGVVRGHAGQPVANANIYVYTSGWQFITSTTTDADGRYSVGINGTVIIRADAGWPQSAAAPASWSMYRYNVAISGSTTLDIDLPVVKVSGSVTDSNGAPVNGVALQGESNSWDSALQTSFSSNMSVSSDIQGRYDLLMFSGSGAITVRPPAASGFSPVSLSSLNLSGDLTQRIILQRPDLSPPQIVAGPIVVHLSDDSVSISWTTNEAATSRVEYGLGSLTSVVTDNDLVTNHTVTLLNLSPVSIYSFRVGSTDSSGNGPVYSEVGTFTTQGPPGDVTAPLITDGPTVVFVDQTRAIVQWTTDEPANSAVSFGPSDALGTTVAGAAGKFTDLHSIKLEGLSPETQYFARVASTDPDGNGMTSSIFTFTTLAVPDTAAPTITAGPSISVKTDTKITVAWTTNEPATSGVSYNDGTQFFVVNDATLTRNHEITLSDLQPQTLYHITVSSTDAVGNGPTLGGPVDETTNATPDTTAPEISNLQVMEITETSAVVVWTTNEPSSSSAAFGTASGAPDNSKADLDSVIEHRLVLTGLQDGKQYFLTVSSTDGSGNTATSGEIDFKTVSSFVDMPPSAPGPITAPAGPTNAASFAITWGASTDDLGVSAYEIVRNDEVIASVAPDTTSYVEEGLAEGRYTYVIRSLDTAGHVAANDPVTVIVDRTPPVVAVPADITVDAVGTSAQVQYEAYASDNVDTQVTVVCTPAAGTFGIGKTMVECSATDMAGNTGAASFAVLVRDVTAPEIAAVTPSQRLLWPPNHQMVALSLSVDASDLASTPVCRITDISSNEAVDGLGDGDLAPDWSFEGLAFALRAERSGRGAGRIYTIATECVDAAGNSSTKATTVSVPKSMSGR